MTTTVLEKTGEQLSETVDKAKRTTTAMGEMLQDKFESARHAAKRGVHAAEEMYDDTKQQIKRHPFESVTTTFLLGVAAGAFLGWILRKK